MCTVTGTVHALRRNVCGKQFQDLHRMVGLGELCQHNFGHNMIHAA